MRIQLTVLRHTLPPTHILWEASTRLPPNTGFNARRTTSGTISQLLEDVNEVIPLESEEWGLEDYVVDVGGFECLHFQEIGTVLREGDEVTIRALQTPDLRARRLGGRHQITSDGRHLIDGVAFGRPYLRRSERPSITIPPRKRRRIEDADESQHQEVILGALRDQYRQEGQEDDYAEGDQLDVERSVVLRGEFDDADVDEDEEDEDFVDSDEDAEEDEEEEADLMDELLALRKDQGPDLLDDTSTTLDQSDGKISTRKTPRSTRIPPFTETMASGRLDPRNTTPLAVNSALVSPTTLVETVTQQPSRKRKRTSDSGRSVHFEPSATANVSHADRDFLRQLQDLNGNIPVLNGVIGQPGSDLSGDSSDSGGEDSDRFVDTGLESDDTSEDESQNSSSDSHESSDSDDASEDQSRGSTSSASRDSSSEDDACPSTSSSDENDSDESSDEGSFSEENEDLQPSTSPRTLGPNGHLTPPPNSKAKDRGRSDTKPSSQNALKELLGVDPVVAQLTPPGKGSKATQRNNLRQAKRKRLQHLKELGVLHQEANFRDLEAWEVANNSSHIGTAVTGTKGEEASDFEARRQQLLADIASGGIDVNKPEDRPIVHEPGSQEPQSDVPPDSEIAGAATTPTSTALEKSQGTMSDPQRKRAKLDIASSRRLLFGSLGVKTPKSKAEEEDTRRYLAGTPRPSSSRQAEEVLSLKPRPEDAVENWQERINLRAVECTFEGVRLRPPPFPFAQRWDPDAEVAIKSLKNKGNRRNKKKGRNQNYYYDEPEYQYDGGWEEPEVSHSNYKDATFEDSRGKKIPATAPKEGEQTDDLPPLPSDTNTLSTLTRKSARVGAIIAFKELTMVNFRPEYSNYKTARIEDVTGEGDAQQLQLRLAQRDTERSNARFDDETGQRIYSGLEMPGLEDEEEGTRELSFTDLIESKLVSVAPTPKERDEITHSSGFTTQGGPVAQIEMGLDDVSPSRRENLSDLIHEAGFNSSLPSDLALSPTRGLSARSGPAQSDQDSSQKSGGEVASDPDATLAAAGDVPPGDESYACSSPRFNGFSSSPPRDDDHGNLGDNNARSSRRRVSEKDPLPDVEYLKLPREPEDENDDQSFGGFDDEMKLGGAVDGNGKTSAKLSEAPNQPGTLDESVLQGSLKATIPATQESSRPSDVSQASSRVTNPFYTVVDGSGEEETSLPIFEQSAATARSEVSPPVSKNKRKTRTSQRIRSSSRLFTPSSPDRSTQDDIETQNERSSQLPEGSQVVDLTFSSSPVSPRNSDGDFAKTRGLPHGPRWVKKVTRATNVTVPNGKRSARRTRKSS